MTPSKPPGFDQPDLFRALTGVLRVRGQWVGAMG